MIEQLQASIQDALIYNCPTDTGFMSTNIYLYDYGEYWLIRIATTYAQAVNYRRVPRSPKEEKNKHWVERTVMAVANQYGANVIVEV